MYQIVKDANKKYNEEKEKNMEAKAKGSHLITEQTKEEEVKKEMEPIKGDYAQMVGELTLRNKALAPAIQYYKAEYLRASLKGYEELAGSMKRHYTVVKKWMDNNAVLKNILLKELRDEEDVDVHKLLTLQAKIVKHADWKYARNCEGLLGGVKLFTKILYEMVDQYEEQGVKGLSIKAKRIFKEMEYLKRELVSRNYKTAQYNVEYEIDGR